ncbi:tetratricopeptide repeat protein [Nocardia vulneris]|uniref:Tetratricopeptide repeat protein n=1 Tax=Nocardia vulneris TaxID=1141657 RepID=A0ABR4Z441_9NOCA|nr:tetratricopeptide repeat protein [Nocardia vulneris]KIA60039.1 hypothetical protein FG87_39375 [Nocardia vulneris]
MNETYSSWAGRNSPEDLPLADRYQSAEPIVLRGSKIYPMYTEQVGPAPTAVTLTLLSAAPPPGLRGLGMGVSVVNGYVALNGRRLAGVDVWSDALVGGITFDIVGTGSGTLVTLTPVWVDAFGEQKSWVGNYGIVIETTPDDRIVLWCSIGEGPANFANLVLEVQSAPIAQYGGDSVPASPTDTAPTRPLRSMPTPPSGELPAIPAHAPDPGSIQSVRPPAPNGQGRTLAEPGSPHAARTNPPSAPTPATQPFTAPQAGKDPFTPPPLAEPPTGNTPPPRLPHPDELGWNTSSSRQTHAGEFPGSVPPTRPYTEAPADNGAPAPSHTDAPAGSSAASQQSHAPGMPETHSPAEQLRAEGFAGSRSLAQQLHAEGLSANNSAAAPPRTDRPQANDTSAEQRPAGSSTGTDAPAPQPWADSSIGGSAPTRQPPPDGLAWNSSPGQQVHAADHTPLARPGTEGPAESGFPAPQQRAEGSLGNGFAGFVGSTGNGSPAPARSEGLIGNSFPSRRIQPDDSAGNGPPVQQQRDADPAGQNFGDRQAQAERAAGPAAAQMPATEHPGGSSFARQAHGDGPLRNGQLPPSPPLSRAAQAHRDGQARNTVQPASRQARAEGQVPPAMPAAQAQAEPQTAPPPSPPPPPDDAVTVDTGYRAALYDLGVAMYSRGEEDQACGLWAQAAEAGHPGAAYDLGVVRFRRGDLEDAERWWRTAADRREPRAMAGLAELLDRQGNYAEARVWRVCAEEERSTNA